MALIAIASVSALFIRGRSAVHLLIVGIAWLIPVAYQTLFNMVAMQSFTSYAGTNESTGFGRDYFLANWEKMIRTLHDQGLFFIAPIGVLGLLLMLRRMPIFATVLILWFVPSVLLYTAYYWAPDNRGVSYSRFVLSQMPALMVSAAWLMGEAVGLSRTANRRGWLVPNWTRAGLASLVLIAGVAMVYVGVGGPLPWRDEATQQLAKLELRAATSSLWWLLVPTGAILVVSSAATLLANATWAARFRESFEWHTSGTPSRLAIGVVVFVAASVGLIRVTEGVEWGARINERASIERAAVIGNNLAGLGRTLRDAVNRGPDGKRVEGQRDQDVIVFSDGNNLNHLQWVGAWTLFAADAFTADAGRRYPEKQAFVESDPDPIDPNYSAFMRSLYAGKNDKILFDMQNKLMADALAQGKRVFYILNKPAAALFERRYVTNRPFETRHVATWCDMPAPRLDVDFLPPEERPKLPSGMGLPRPINVPTRFITPDRQTFRVVEIVAKPIPATPLAPPAPVPPVPAATPAPAPKPAAPVAATPPVAAAAAAPAPAAQPAKVNAATRPAANRTTTRAASTTRPASTRPAR